MMEPHVMRSAAGLQPALRADAYGGLLLRLRRCASLDGCGRLSAAPPSTGAGACRLRRPRRVRARVGCAALDGCARVGCAALVECGGNVGCGGCGCGSGCRAAPPLTGVGACQPTPAVRCAVALAGACGLCFLLLRSNKTSFHQYALDA